MREKVGTVDDWIDLEAILVQNRIEEWPKIMSQEQLFGSMEMLYEQLNDNIVNGNDKAKRVFGPLHAQLSMIYSIDASGGDPALTKSPETSRVATAWYAETEESKISASRLGTDDLPGRKSTSSPVRKKSKVDSTYASSKTTSAVDQFGKISSSSAIQGNRISTQSNYESDTSSGIDSRTVLFYLIVFGPGLLIVFLSILGALL